MRADSAGRAADVVAEKSDRDAIAARQALKRLGDARPQKELQDKAYREMQVEANRRIAAAHKKAAGDGPVERQAFDSVVGALSHQGSLYRARIDSLESRAVQMAATLDTVRTARFTAHHAMQARAESEEHWKLAAQAARHQADVARTIAVAERRKRHFERVAWAAVALGLGALAIASVCG